MNRIKNKRHNYQTKKSVIDLYGQIHILRNRLVDQNDNPVILRGMSLFWSQFLDKYYNYNCIRWLRDDWNCNIIRIPLGIEQYGYLENPDEELEKIYRLIRICFDLGIYIIIDWHDHHAQYHIEQATSFFKNLAQLYGDKPNIIYEIYNEPLDVSWTKVVKPYAENIIQVIRKIDPDNLIIVGTPCFSQNVNEAADDPLQDINTAYSLHFYAASHKQLLRDKAIYALQKGLALFVTEWGSCEYTGDGEMDYDETEKWLNFMNKNKLSWCNWSISDKNETSSALKSNANVHGGWTLLDLTPSGTFVREKLKKLNAPVDKLF
jgi:endoglucanase